jgi:hypothetical protein
MYNIFYTAIDAGPDDDNERFAVEPDIPSVGQWVSMNDDAAIKTFRIISTKLFQSVSGTEIIVASLAQEPMQEALNMSAIYLYFLETAYYSCGYAMGFEDTEISRDLLLPKLGEHVEFGYEGIKPVDKEAIAYETFHCDGQHPLYLVHLKRIKAVADASLFVR